MTLPIDDDRRIAREAVRWTQILRDENADTADTNAFADWALTSPAHVHHFLIESALNDALKYLKPTPHRSAEQWIALARDTATPVDESSPLTAAAQSERTRCGTSDQSDDASPWPLRPGLVSLPQSNDTPGPDSPRRWRHPFSQGSINDFSAQKRETDRSSGSDEDESAPAPAAREFFGLTKIHFRLFRPSSAIVAVALLCAVIGAMWLLNSNGTSKDYSTTIGQSRIVELDDGSVMSLRAETLAHVHFSSSLREVGLLNGGATFKVQHDPARPFQVKVTNATIVAVGTQFDVTLQDAQALVKVSEGRVRITGRARASAPREVSAGQQVQILADGWIEVVREQDRPGAAEPSNVPFQFNRRPLAEVAEAFNQRNRVPQFIVEGSACERPITAALKLNDPSALMLLLQADRALTLKQQGDSVVVRERGDATPRAANPQNSCAQRATNASHQPQPL